jgi:hypothetical protein
MYQLGGNLMISKRGITAAVLCAFMVTGAAQAAERLSHQTVLVVPPRYRVMQLAFDMVKLRKVLLVSYQVSPSSGALLMHAWNPHAGNWSEITSENLLSPNYQGLGTVIVGQHADAFASGANVTGWAGAVKRIPSVLISDIVNGLDGIYRFRPHEWRWLAGRYEFQIDDTNYEQRRYGRYGPPNGTSAAAPVDSMALEPVSTSPDAVESFLDDSNAAEPARVESVPVPVEPVAASWPGPRKSVVVVKDPDGSIRVEEKPEDK